MLYSPRYYAQLVFIGSKFPIDVSFLAAKQWLDI